MKLNQDFIDWSNNHCVYPPCEHFWLLFIVMGITVIVLLIIVMYFRLKTENEVGK